MKRVMGKRVIGISVSIIFAILLCSYIATAYTQLEVYQDRCYADGSISVTVVNGKNEPINLNETKLLVQNAYARNKTFSPEGRWTKPVTYYNMTSGKAQESTFISNEDLITEPGDYHIFINYAGCRQGRCTTAATVKNCLAHSIDCYKYKPLVYSCSIDPEERMAYVSFGGEKNKFFTEVDPARDLIYYITSDQRDLQGVRRVEGVSFSKLGDVREMRFPLLKDETINDVAIVHNRCQSRYQEQKRIVCSIVQRAGARGINNALRGEQTSVEVPPPAQQTAPAPPEIKAQQELVEKIINKKEEENQQKVAQVKQELENTKAELDAYKQANQPAAQPIPIPTAVPAITGAATGAGARDGVPTSFIVLVALVVIGILVFIATNMYSKKKNKEEQKKKKDDERKEKSFGFGD